MSVTISTYNYLPAARGFLVEGSLDTSQERASRESRIPRSDASAALVFTVTLVSPAGALLLSLFCYSKTSLWDRVYAKGTPSDVAAGCKLTGVTHLFFLKVLDNLNLGNLAFLSSLLPVLWEVGEEGS